MPGWVKGKVDQLHFHIYEKLKTYEVRSPGGNIAPAPEPAPAAPTPMPEEGSASGSAAPPPAPSP